MAIPSFAEKKIMDCKTLGIKIRERRNAMGLTQAEIAGICNVGVRFISELENGKTTVEFGKVLNVMQGLGLEFLLRSKTWM